MTKRKPKTKPAAPQPPVRPPDRIGDLLIAAGLVSNSYLLDINMTLEAPADTRTEFPWCLESRLFRFPIEVGACVDGERALGLIHPLLADHPFVKRVEAALGFELDRNGAPNPYGYTHTGMGLWWHSVDLIQKNWKELIETRQFTTDRDILRGVIFALHFGAKITTPVARRLLTQHLRLHEPADRLEGLKLFSKPSFCKPDYGAGYWAINEHFQNGEPPDQARVAWAYIHAIEARWFVHQSRYLHWSADGRSIWEAAATGKEVATVENKDGQFGFIL